MWELVGQLVRWAITRIATKEIAIGAGTTVAALTLEDFRNKAQVLAGASDIQALDEAARTAARMLGLDGSRVLMPMDRLGNHIAPKYFHVDLVKGRAWFTSEYFSRKSVRVLGRRFGRGRSRFATKGYANRMRFPR